MLVRPGNPRVHACRVVLGSLAASMAVVGLPGLAAAAAPTAPFISEIHYDNAGADTGEFVEVEFPAGTSATGWQIYHYNGNGGGVIRNDPVVPQVTDDATVGVVEYSGTLQNGPAEGLALVAPDGIVKEFVSYEGAVTAVGGPATGQTSTDIGVSQSGSDAVGLTLSKRYDTETEALRWFGPEPGSKGQVNPAFTPVPPPPPSNPCAVPTTHEIGAVQGSGPATTVAGTVVVRGTVVGDVPGLSGFYLQDSDGDAATSDGIFAFSTVPVDLGDEVAVKGTPGERDGQTQISARGDAEVCGDGVLPAPALLDLPAADADRERLEGMLVAPADTLTVSEVFDLTSFGELTLSEGGLLVQPTELARPGTEEARTIATGNTLRRIVLDDGVSARVSTTTRPYLSSETPVRVGDELAFASPTVLGYGFGQWRLQPADGTAAGTFAQQNSRPAAPDEVGGDVQVGAFNVLNYFLTLGNSGVARGATTPEAFEKQAAKIVTAIGALDADVVTLMEIEDTDSTGYSPGNADAALADLVNRLNAAGGADVWGYVPLPEELYAVDRDVIRNGIIYRADAVQAINKPVGLVDETVWANAREPIAQLFKPRGGADGDRFYVVANHFKSKSPGASTGDNVDAKDGQGQWNGDRVRQAASLVEFVEALSSKKGEDDVLLLGDFNAYTMEDPMQVFREAGYTDLGSALDGERYSYVFDDMSGSLDHALASASLTAKVTGVAHWNINSVESFAYQYTGDPALYAPHPYRSSDHDPVVLGLDLDE